MSGPLSNHRHELFAQGIAKGLTADEAYQEAGYAENRGNASRLKSDESISARVAELLSAAADEVIFTAADLARQLDEDRKFAQEMKSPAAAVAASMGKGKVLGIIRDKIEHTGKNGGPIQMQDATPLFDPDDMDEDELELYEELVRLRLEKVRGG